MTRGEIQGFVDGYLKAGGDVKNIRNELSSWMADHPLYPQPKEAQDSVVADIESYRGIAPEKAAPAEPVVEPAP